MTEENKPKKPNIILRFLALVVTLALIVGAMALVIYRDELNVAALERWLRYRDLQTGETGQAEPFTHAGGDSLSLACLDRGILFSSDTGARYYSVNGEVYAEQVLSMESPVLSASDSAGVVYDAGGQHLYLFGGGEQRMALKLEGDADLLSARVNDAGWLTVTAQQSGYKGAVTVYNAKNEKAIQISLSSTFAVDAALSPDCKRVAVVTIGQSGGSFDTEVLFYPINGTEPSARLSLGNLVVLDMDFEDDRLWLLCDDRVLTVSPDGEDAASYAFGSDYLKGYDLDGDGFALLLFSSYETGGADRMLTVDAQGTVLAQRPLSGQVLDYDCAGNYTALLTGTDLTVYDSGFTLYARLDDTRSARFTALRSDASAALATHQQCWLYIPE